MNVTLYQIDSKGKARSWQIRVVNNTNSSDIVIETGLIDGKKVVNTTTISEGKNFGKANQTNHYTQAISEAKSTLDSQIRKGYVYDLKYAKSSSVLGSGIPAPMLAQKYHPTGEQSSSKTLSQLGLNGKEVIVQPKLDGNRCMIKIENGKIEMYTRKGDLCQSN